MLRHMHLIFRHRGFGASMIDGKTSDLRLTDNVAKVSDGTSILRGIICVEAYAFGLNKTEGLGFQ